MNRRMKLVQSISGTTSPMGVLGAACFLGVIIFIAAMLATDVVKALL